MKTKHIIIITILVILVLGLCFGGYSLFQAWNEDIRTRDAEIITLKEEYKLFSEEATAFNNIKVEFDTKLDEIYYNTLKEEQEVIQTILTRYQESKSRLVELGDSMSPKCEKYSKKSDVKTLCDSYETSLETANNIYKEDIARYQELIIEYNDWVKDHPGYEKIEEYQE